jgi:Ca2+-binding RTX toxin-like protein
MKLRLATAALAGALAMAGVGPARAQVNVRNDVIAKMRTDGLVALDVNEQLTTLTLNGGTAALQLDTPGCVVSPPARPSCVATLGYFTIGVEPFSVVVGDGTITVSNGFVAVYGPIVIKDTGSGYVLPAGTQTVFNGELSGTQSDGNPLPPQSISAVAPLSAAGTITLAPATQDLAVDGTFPFSITSGPNTITGSVTIMGSAQKPFANVAPVAVAGPDRTVGCGHAVTLSSSGSQDADNNIASFTWTENSVVIATGATAQVTLPFGTHFVVLEVRDKNGALGTDTVKITVQATPPVFTSVPPAITGALCGPIAIGQATATSACGPVTVTNNAPASFRAGRTIVTWKATGPGGLVTTATQLVTAFLGNDPACCPVGSHIIIGTSNNDTLNGTAGVDCILGLGAQDTINGGGGNDIISGGDGDDVISGGPGNDVLSGGTGQDRLFGNNDADSLFGNDGDDVLDGGLGNDVLDGGAHQDTCIGGGGINQFISCVTVR